MKKPQPQPTSSPSNHYQYSSQQPHQSGGGLNQFVSNTDNISIPSHLSSNNNNRNYHRKHNSPDVMKLRQQQQSGNTGGTRREEHSPYNNQKKSYQQGGNGVGVGNKNLKQQQQQQQENYQKSDYYNKAPQQQPTQHAYNNNRLQGQNIANQQKQLTKTSSSPKLLQTQQQQRTEQMGPSGKGERDKLYTETDEYQKLHEKLNSIEDKIMNMKKNIQRKREEKHKILEKQKRERLEQEKRIKSQEKSSSKSGSNDVKKSLGGLVTQVPEHKELHTFERNPYSPRHNIYYVSEVVRAYLDEKSLAREHILTSLHILRVLQSSNPASDQEMLERQVQIPYRRGNQNRKCIVFDLDETLIHCNDSLQPPHDVKLPIKFPTGQIIQAGVNIRPYARQILKNLSKHFQIIIFTASHSCYANVVLDYLDPKNQYIDYRLYRQHCYQTQQGMYVKDLRVMNRRLQDVLLVDNAAYSYAFQLDNGIPILPYYHGSNDYELRTLEKYIMENKMMFVNDVRDVNRKTFKLHMYRDYYDEPEVMVEELYIGEEEEQQQQEVRGGEDKGGQGKKKRNNY